MVVWDGVVQHCMAWLQGRVKRTPIVLFFRLEFLTVTVS